MRENKSSVIEVNSLDELYKFNIKNISAAVGVFDGVHLGHRHLISQLSSDAKKNNSTPVIITFYPHPKSVISPENKPKLLTPHEKKIALLSGAGANAIVTIPFTKEFSMLEPEQFLESFLSPQKIKISSIFVGSNWKFGFQGKGNFHTLANFAKKRLFSCHTVKELTINGEKISSSNIRKAVSSGDFATAEKMLGRPFSIYGKVCKGLSFASSHLNCPTANINTEEIVLPPEGVYSGLCIIDNNSSYPAAISIGTAQSVRQNQQKREILVEAHLIDFSGDLYGKDIEIIFHEYIREQRYFPDIEKLKTQIEKDISLIKNKEEKYRRHHA